MKEAFFLLLKAFSWLHYCYLRIGLEYSSVGVFTFTFLTFPSCPGYTSITRPVIHFPLNAFKSCTMTKSSTQTLRMSTFHFLRGTKKGEHISCPPSPEGVHNLLNELHPFPWIPCLIKRALWNLRRRST